jgi:regulator of protease activity HflC (stomatin/prohibitin superfamily)
MGRRNNREMIMMERLRRLFESARYWLSRRALESGYLAATGAERLRSGLAAARSWIVLLALAGGAGYLAYRHPPVMAVGSGEIGIRRNRFTGAVDQWREGGVLVLPGVHELRTYSLRDQTYRPRQSGRADGPSPLQSVEGLSLGVDLSFRYALDPLKVAALARNLPDDIGGDIVEPAVQGTIYKVFARYTVREIFSTKRAEIQQAIESELKPKLAADGILLRDMLIGKVDLPADYRRGMEALLAEELATEKMRYTLELKDKRIRETELEAEAQKVRREKTAEAAAREQVIAAQGQEEAMKHVLPFKERQVEQRKLEAEAEKASRLKLAEANAQARRIEATGEADARRQLAEAEAYRVELVGKVSAEQMAREGAVITRHPLLIQKALADKLSDKIRVIVAPPPSDGVLLGTLLGGQVREQP